MPRPRTIAIGAFALLLAASPFLPRGGGDDGALRPSGEQKPAVLLPADAVSSYAEMVPSLEAHTVAGANHYTILFDPDAVAQVAAALTA